MIVPFLFRSKVVTGDSVPSSGQQSPVLSVPSPQLSNTALHRAKPDQGSVNKDQQKSTHQRPGEQKTGRSKSARSAEKLGERTGKSSSSKHHGSVTKHKTPRTQLLNKT